MLNSAGDAVAYIDVEGDLTIYLWGGKPVAYLSEQDHVYGFNGDHLGWFVDGALIDHSGYVSCVIKSRFGGYPKYESYKGYKNYKPYKRWKKYAPSQPAFVNSFGYSNCSLLLALGNSD